MPTGPDPASFTRRGFVRVSGAAAALLLAGYGSSNADLAAAATPMGSATTPSPKAGPFWLPGNFAPVRGETTVDRLRVSGRIPTAASTRDQGARRAWFATTGTKPRHGTPRRT
jgi:hypothetical protein